MLYLAWLSTASWQMKALWLAADGMALAGALGLAMNLALTGLFYAAFDRRGEA